MRRDKALAVLDGLRLEAGAEAVLTGGGQFTAWKAKVRGTLATALGETDDIVRRFDALRFGYTGPAWNGMDRSVYARTRAARIQQACGLIEAAVHRIEVIYADDELTNPASCTPKVSVLHASAELGQPNGRPGSMTATSPDRAPSEQRRILKAGHYETENAVANGFQINRSAIEEMTRELQREFDLQGPITIPVETDASGAALPSITYNGPVVIVNGDHAQLAWDNKTVAQTQQQTEAIAPGYEELAKVVTTLLAELGSIGLDTEAAEEVREQSNVVLGEIVKAEPDKRGVKRATTLMKGLLAPLLAGTSGGVAAETAEFVRSTIDQLGTALPI